jgi:hypothetical protein
MAVTLITDHRHLRINRLPLVPCTTRPCTHTWQATYIPWRYHQDAGKTVQHVRGLWLLKIYTIYLSASQSSGPQRAVAS